VTSDREHFIRVLSEWEAATHQEGCAGFGPDPNPKQTPASDRLDWKPGDTLTPEEIQKLPEPTENYSEA
jgi:hypothetical protein